MSLSNIAVKLGLGRPRRKELSAEWSKVFPSVISEIQGGNGRIRFIDGAFPAHGLHHWVQDCTLAFVPGERTRTDFMRRFRNSGGTAPLLQMSGTGNLLDWTALHDDAAEMRTWVYLDSKALSEALISTFANFGICMLVTNEDSSPVETGVEQGGLREWTPVRFDLRDGSFTGFAAWLPPTAQHDAQLISRSAPQGKLGSLFRGRRPKSAAGTHLRSLTVSSHNTDLPFSMLPAHRLVTDGCYAAEVTPAHSRLWTGPHLVSRFAMGKVPAGARSLIVRISPDSFHKGLSANIAAQINGISTRHTLKQSHGNAVEIAVEIPPAETNDCVLGIACRIAHKDEMTDRIVRLCIESIGFAR